MEAHISLQVLQDFNQASSPPTTIKMEDLCQEQMAPAAPQSSNTSSTSVLNMSMDSKPDNTSSSSSSSKPTKKRKSWGQILPEPKTNLPPRKRAKTADEKEQRRIERVKRNRLAAHNSRERKRQEVDALQEEKQALEQRVRDMETELTTYRQMFPQANVPQAAPLAETVPFQGVSILDSYKDEYKQDDFKQEPSNIVTPSLASFESPDSLRSNLDSPIDTAPSTPGTEMMNSDSDPTQHSAAMLCDLQCRSDINSSIISTAKLQTALTTIFLFNIQIFLMTAASTVFSTSPSFRTAVTAWLAARNLSSTRASASRLPTYLATPVIFWSHLMQASSICSPAQARLLQSATQRALQRRALSNNKLRWSNGLTRSVKTAAKRQSRRETNRRTTRGRVQRFNCNNSSLARDIKRSCMIIARRSHLESGGRQKQPSRF
jgi:hypothetical protein